MTQDRREDPSARRRYEVTPRDQRNTKQHTGRNDEGSICSCSPRALHLPGRDTDATAHPNSGSDPSPTPSPPSPSPSPTPQSSPLGRSGRTYLGITVRRGHRATLDLGSTLRTSRRLRGFGFQCRLKRRHVVALVETLFQARGARQVARRGSVHGVHGVNPLGPRL